MFLTLTNNQLQNIKEVALYKANFNFLGVQLALAADTLDAIEVFSAMYRNFITSTQPTPHITCYIQKSTGTANKPIALEKDTP
jgi:hypothetical protein